MEETATPMDAPGKPRRPEDYEKLIELMNGYSPDPRLTRTRLFDLVMQGMPWLKGNAQRLLAFYVSRLDAEKIVRDQPWVYVKNEDAARHLGLDIRTIQRAKLSLEHEWLIWRDMNAENRPVRDGGIDLRPLIARFAELWDGKQAIFDGLRAEEAARRQSDVSSFVEVKSWRGDNSVAQLRTKDSLNQSTTENRTKTDTQKHPEKDPTEVSSPRGAGQFSAFTPRQGGISEQQQGSDALAVSSRLVKWRSELDPGTSTIERLVAAGAAALSELAGDDLKRAHAAWSRVVARRGWAALEGLVVALEGGTVTKPVAWMFWYSSPGADGYDLGVYLSRIVKARPRQAPKSAESGPETPEDMTPAGLFRREIERDLGEATARNWFGAANVLNISHDGGELHIEVPTGFVRDWLLRNHEHHMLQTARRLGWQISSLKIVVREKKPKPGDGA